MPKLKLNHSISRATEERSNELGSEEISNELGSEERSNELGSEEVTNWGCIRAAGVNR